MKDDNTPTVVRKKRKLSSRSQLRAQTAARLRSLSAAKSKRSGGKDRAEIQPLSDFTASKSPRSAISARPARIKSLPRRDDVTQRKFRKRQRDKTWLPTHMYHVKRAHLTPPSRPLWGFAVPLTPTAKSFRPTHRAASQSGAIAYDMSYMSTLMLRGRLSSLMNVLAAQGVSRRSTGLRKGEYQKWRSGYRAVDTVLHTREAPNNLIAPATLILQPELAAQSTSSTEQQERSLLIRVHPSAYPQLWTELTRSSKVAKPAVHVHDLRYQLGSIEVRGPGATEALASVLWPHDLPGQDIDAKRRQTSIDSATVLQRLSGLSGTAVLPAGVVLGLDIQDPRLHHPPRRQKRHDYATEQDQILSLAGEWPYQSLQGTASIFDRQVLYNASTGLPTQKSIQRRKAAAAPGKYPEVNSALDPRIPVLLYTSASDVKYKSLSGWTVLLPWKCVLPVWYPLMYVPLSSGNQPRFGGLDQQRNLALEFGCPWFPADFPATKAGYQWELEQRRQSKSAWDRRPKSKRVMWDGLDLGNGVRGEVGSGFACDWERLLHADEDSAADEPADKTKLALDLLHLSSLQYQSLLTADTPLISISKHALICVRVSIINRGVADDRARIYRLPTEKASRAQWLALRSEAASHQRVKTSTRLLETVASDAVQRKLARSLLEPSPVGSQRLPCPLEADLIGFVTTGHFDLGAGRGIAIGSLAVHKLLEGDSASFERTKKGPKQLCIIRNSGQTVCRLAEWTVV